MSSKIGFVLSLIFVFVFFLFGGDLVGIQYVYTSLDAKSVTIAYKIAKDARADEEYITSLENEFNVILEITNEITPLYGDECNFIVSTYYNPLVVSTIEIPLRVQRSTVLGYYG